MNEWKDYYVCCAGGCGVVLEDGSGAVVNVAHYRFENTTEDGTPIALLLCESCAAEEDLRTMPSKGEPPK